MNEDFARFRARTNVGTRALCELGVHLWLGHETNFAVCLCSVPVVCHFYFSSETIGGEILELID